MQSVLNEVQKIYVAVSAVGTANIAKLVALHVSRNNSLPKGSDVVVGGALIEIKDVLAALMGIMLSGGGRLTSVTLAVGFMMLRSGFLSKVTAMVNRPSIGWMETVQQGRWRDMLTWAILSRTRQLQFESSEVRVANVLGNRKAVTTRENKYFWQDWILGQKTAAFKELTEVKRTRFDADEDLDDELESLLRIEDHFERYGHGDFFRSIMHTLGNVQTINRRELYATLSRHIHSHVLKLFPEPEDAVEMRQTKTVLMVAAREIAGSWRYQPFSRK